MNAVPGQRIAAYGLDIAGCAGIALCTVPLGLLLRRTRYGNAPSSTLWLSTTPVVIATFAAAVAESRGATFGKRACNLRVEQLNGRQLSFGKALLRNSVKIAVPWHLGHVVAIRAAFADGDDVDTTTFAAAAVTCSLQLAAVAGVLTSGVTLHDILSGSRVVAASADTTSNPGDRAHRFGGQYGGQR